MNPSASPTCPEKSRSSNLTFHLFHCSRLTGILSLSCQNFNFLPRRGKKTNQWFLLLKFQCTATRRRKRHASLVARYASDATLRITSNVRKYVAVDAESPIPVTITT